MKTLQRTVACAFCLVLAESAFSATGYSLNVVGYYNRAMTPGVNLIANQLNASPDNSLNTILAGSVVPDGSTFTMWNGSSFDPLSVYNTSTHTWSINYNLGLGDGGYFTTPSVFTNTFVGNVGPYLDIGLTNGGNNINWNPGYANGLHLISNPSPVSGDLNFTFLNVVGRAPVAGEGVAILTDGLTLSYTKYFYDGGGTWVDESLNSVNPSSVVPVGSSAWFALGVNYSMTIPSAVPEPGVFALIGMGAVLLLRRNRRA